MSLFDFRRKKIAPTSAALSVETEPDEGEFVAATLVPRKVPMTADMMRRQREEELRRKCGCSTVKTGYII